MNKPQQPAEPKLCRLCDQPMKPKGVKKMPDEYDHASGCPYAANDNIQRKRNLDRTMRQHNIAIDERGLTEHLPHHTLAGYFND